MCMFDFILDAERSYLVYWLGEDEMDNALRQANQAGLIGRFLISFKRDLEGFGAVTRSALAPSDYPATPQETTVAGRGQRLLMCLSLV